MKLFSITAFGDTHQVYVKTGLYHNNRISISLIDADDHIPYAIASVNLPNVLLLDKEVAIKDYSENEGIFKFLCDNNIITDTGKHVISGFVTVPIGRLNPELSWGSVPNLYSQDEPEHVQLDPVPDEINIQSGKSMWIINDIRIWADTYQHALEQYHMIESF